MPFERFNAPTDFKKKKIRDKLFARLAEAPIWQNPKGGSAKNVPCRELEGTRGEAFFGAVIGSFPPPSGWKPEGRRLISHDAADCSSIYMVNDVHGPSGYRPWSALFETFDIGAQSLYARLLLQLRTEAVLALLKLLDEQRMGAPKNKAGFRRIDLGDIDALLQCNINIYKSSDRLPWHRDDTDYKGQPTTNTFQPAAVTWMLAASRYASEPGIRLVDPKGNEVVNINLDDARGKEAVCGTGSDHLFGINKASYQRGVHTAATKWSSEHPDQFERISFNFRLVRANTWQRLLGAVAP
ncbi:hypothetical protein [Polymorphobacter fuscus]|uniref:Uncharacterized protein n=1 Tax=Sandarakinorhabdus fusca TaxID=1439888 RepID=A0A7C9GT37_9SPHN|nr:hypothetical protein [Polymorphobacter fuscus]KAB7644411.1 hypothetical protein F9290_13830 [Polymorphobacter fuscus]MQT18331.1 hypothetical protein [Polymorphobacter fuscus]NJC08230.1 hypothetical protein [Polymorphobacter fuscus]